MPLSARGVRGETTPWSCSLPQAGGGLGWGSKTAAAPTPIPHPSLPPGRGKGPTLGRATILFLMSIPTPWPGQAFAKKRPVWRRFAMRNVLFRESAPRPAAAGRPPRGSRKVAKPHFLERAEAGHRRRAACACRRAGLWHGAACKDGKAASGVGHIPISRASCARLCGSGARSCMSCCSSAVSWGCSPIAWSSSGSWPAW